MLVFRLMDNKTEIWLTQSATRVLSCDVENFSYTAIQFILDATVLS